MVAGRDGRMIAVLGAALATEQKRSMARHATIGHGYACTRHEEPRFRAQIHAALGDARPVVNVALRCASLGAP